MYTPLLLIHLQLFLDMKNVLITTINYFIFKLLSSYFIDLDIRQNYLKLRLFSKIIKIKNNNNNNNCVVTF